MNSWFSKFWRKSKSNVSDNQNLSEQQDIVESFECGKISKAEKKLLKLHEKSKEYEEISANIDNVRTQSRRKFLKVCGAAMLALNSPKLIACNQKEDYFFQNFDYRDYSPFQESDYVEDRDKFFITNKDVLKGLQTAVHSILKSKINIEDLFDFNLVKNYINVRLKIFDENDIIDVLRTGGIDAQSVKLIVNGNKISLDIFLKTGDIKILVNVGGFKIFNRTGSEELNALSLGRKQSLNVFEVDLGHCVKFKDEDLVFMEDVRLFNYGDISCTVNYDSYSEFNKNGKNWVLSDTKSFLQFLNECKSTDIIKAVLRGKFNISDILNMEQLIEIMRLLPKDPIQISSFMRSAITYRSLDKGPEDEYKHPIETLRLGWGECDDYALIFYFWAYLHNYNPYIVFFRNKNSNGSNHIVSWYQDENGDFFVQSNSYVKKVPYWEDIDEFLKNMFDEYIVAENEHK